MILPIPNNGDAEFDLARNVVRRGPSSGQRSNGLVGQPGLMRTMNLRAVFDIIAAEGPVAATRLVQGTGLSKPTVSEVLRQLLDYNLITRAGRTSGQVGPSAQLYEVSSTSGVVIGIDVGYEWLRVVAADLSGKVVARADERARRRSARQLIEQVGGLVEQVAGPIGSATRYLAVVGTPGVLRPGDSHLALAPHLPGWERPEVLSGLRELVACPVVFENDVNLAAIGELSRGAGRGVDDFVLVSIGTGLGMGVVLDGRLHRGASGLAGEVGYLPTAGAEHIEAAIGLRGQGAMERLVSSHAVVDLAKEAGLSPASSAAAVIDAARAGDPVALQVVDTIAARLAFCIASVAAVLDPELVIVGGGIGTGAGPLLLEPLRRNLAAISPLRPRRGTSELGSAAVVVGAVTEGLRLVVERIFDVDASPATAAVGAPGAAS
jgi:predicted NBD/HSP70 family sugar kinase